MNTQRSMRRIVALAAAAPLMLVAACGDNPEPAPMPTNAASATPTDETSDSPAVPELPAEAKENTPDGAEAFVRHWVEAFNVAAQSGGTDVVRDGSDEACTPCVAMYDAIDAIHADGGRVEGGLWNIDAIRAVPGADDTVVVDADVNVSPQLLKESSTADVVEYDGGRSLKIFTLRYDGQWQIASLEQP